MPMKFSGITIQGGLSLTTNPGLFDDAVVYYPMKTIIGSAADGTDIPVITNYGTGGSTYTATKALNSAYVRSYGGQKALYIRNGDYSEYDLGGTLSVPSNMSFFMVGAWDGNRITAFGFRSAGGSGPGPYDNCKITMDGYLSESFKVIGGNNTGMELSGLYQTGSNLKVFGFIKTGSTISYYDNSTTPVTWSGTFTGDLSFNTVGFNKYWGGYKEYSTGYLGDTVYFDYAVSTQKAAAVVTRFKTLYSIP